MRRLLLAISGVLSLAAALPVFAASSSADVDHLHVQLVIPDAAIGVRSQPTNAGLYFKLEQGWHVYWKNAGDSGEPPRIRWTMPAGITAGPLEFPPPSRLPLGPLMDFGYENEVLFPFTLTADSSAVTGPTTLHAHVNWLVCREVCIPGKADLEITRTVTAGPGTSAPVEPDASLFARLGNNLPQPLPRQDNLGFVSTPAGLRLTVLTGQRETQASFFPAEQNILENPAPQELTPTAKGFTLELKKDAELKQAPTELSGVLELSGGRAFQIAAKPGPPAPPVPLAAANPATSASPVSTASTASTADSAAPGILRIIGLAFLGGIILNLMPCVFPVLFLKGLALVNSGREERHQLRTHGLVYALGILVSFWTLVGVLLGLRAAGARLGWGFQFQSPIFLFLMAGLLFFLGLSLAGQFEIGLTLTSAGGSLAQKRGYSGSFFTGVLAVIVATPCTAPFMGAAIGYALAAPSLVTFAVFTALALGLAAPYVALTLQPAWTRILPRPGAWMEVLRQVVSLPIFGFVIWLAWVIAESYGSTMLAALLAGFLLLAVAGWFLGRWPAKRWSAVLAGLISLLFVGLGVYSNSVVVPGFQPGQVVTYQLPPGASWQPWSEAAVQQYQSQGRPVFVDFTAKWCLSCQVNERVALTRPEVMKAFEDAHVALLKADWTQQDPAIAQALQTLGRNGVPAYALYPPGQGSPSLLPEALTPGIVMDAIHKLPAAALPH